MRDKVSVHKGLRKRSRYRAAIRVQGVEIPWAEAHATLESISG